MHRIQFILVSACALVTHSLHAQASGDTTGSSFRRGQWGVEFIPSRSLAEGGVLRFSTPTRAWVLDGSATFDRQHASGTDASETDVTLQSASVIARFGPRWYHAEYERVVRFVGLGVTGGYSNASGSAPGSSRLEYWSVGGYGELGLQYLFTRHLGLGGRADLVGWWTSNHSTQVVSGGSTTEHLTTYHVGLEPVQIIGTFYF